MVFVFRADWSDRAALPAAARARLTGHGSAATVAASAIGKRALSSEPMCARVPMSAEGLNPRIIGLSACREHHVEQHRIGETAFKKRYGLALAAEFARQSRHWRVLQGRS